MNMLPAKVVEADASGTTVALSSGQRGSSCRSKPRIAATRRHCHAWHSSRGPALDPRGTIPARSRWSSGSAA